MKRIYRLTVALTKSWLRSKSGIFFSFLFPILLLLIFGMVFGEQSVSFTLFVQNQDVGSDGAPTELSNTFIKALNSTGVFDIQIVPLNVDAVQYAVQKVGRIRSPRILIIPRGFQDDALNATVTARITVIIDTFRYLMEEYGQYIGEEYRQNMEEGLRRLEEWNESMPKRVGRVVLIFREGDQAAATIKGVVMNVVSTFNSKLVGVKDPVKVVEEEMGGKVYRAVDYYLPGYIAAFIMTNGVIGLSGIVSDYRRRGIIKRFATTPLTKFEWIMANIIQQSVLALLLTLVMVAFGWTVFNIYPRINLLTLALIFLGALMSSGMGMIVGGALRDPEAASAAGNSIAFPMMFLSGSFWPLEIMPKPLQEVASYLPLTYLSEGLRNAMIYGDTAAALTSMLIVMAWAAVFVAAAVMLTRWKER